MEFLEKHWACSWQIIGREELLDGFAKVTVTSIQYQLERHFGVLRENSVEHLKLPRVVGDTRIAMVRRETYPGAAGDIIKVTLSSVRGNSFVSVSDFVTCQNSLWVRNLVWSGRSSFSGRNVGRSSYGRSRGTLST